MTLPAAFLAGVNSLIPAGRRFDDPLSTLAFGTDASFYRLIPKLVHPRRVRRRSGDPAQTGAAPTESR